ncbi:efflux transporter outer membrane subunit [Desulfopila sp. IMCC35006]|uniref:efflux transporter outer membrane subunit n=1 Tax=Desulfopila sp. IMCC35006 TaxID=2569542 RepID=UPI0010AC6281|nr:efflux transporter outer membrane subunit [Desulfopila sp. IMCC35006]TKB28546.1 efflux transporter outer membrane subunit [Desulfopila sp. IMCC35006]
MKFHHTQTLIVSVALSALLAGCTVGPDFKRPAAPDVPSYTATPHPADTADSPTDFGKSQHFVTERRINPQWWHELGSPKLDALIDQALQASPTLAAARANLRQAQEVYGARAGATQYPRIDGNIGSGRQRFSPSSSGLNGDAREFSLYNASVGVHYTFDIAGGTQRALEALAARIDYQRYQLEGARLTVAANIVTTAVTRARLAAQIEATEAILNSQEKQLDLTRERVRLGQANPDDVLALQTQVEQTRAGIPLLRSQLQKNEHLLAVLAGRPPGAAGLPVISLQEFTLPVNLPLIVPSELVRTRPDIQAAEAMLHSANAEYGVAIARLYPQLNLSADLGTQALTTGALFGSDSAVWSLVGQLTQPLFNPGLPAEKRAALAAFDAAAANYRYVVLESLRNVADVLRALDNDAQRLFSLSAATAAAEGSLAAMQHRYGLGAASYVQLVIAEQQLQQTRTGLIEAQAQRMVDSAAFYQAMGGGRLSNDNKVTGLYQDVAP